MITRHILITFVLALFLIFLPSAWSMEQPSFHTKGVPTGKPSGPLKPGEYWWAPQISPSGPVVVLVSIPQQVMSVYRNAVLVARSSVSTGSKDHPTPAGVFTILEKKRSHCSKTYNNAPMPNMQRLTWCGIAFHSGHLPGYAASHGCIRLPYDFSRLLFDLTERGGTVVIGNGKTPQPYFTTDPGLVLSASDPVKGGRPLQNGVYEWNPRVSTEGPITVLISSSDRTLYVTRNGIRIGRAAIRIGGFGKLGDQLFTLVDVTSGKGSLWAPNRGGHRWMAVDTGNTHSRVSLERLHQRISINPEFAVKLHDILTPGATLIVTDQPAERRRVRDVSFGNG